MIITRALRAYAADSDVRERPDASRKSNTRSPETHGESSKNVAPAAAVAEAADVIWLVAQFHRYRSRGTPPARRRRR